MRTWFKKARVEKALTHFELALAVGASVSAVQMWESGRCMPRFKHQRELARVLEVDAPKFFAAETPQG